MNANEAIKPVPLSKITATEQNVRVVQASNASDKALIASIKEKGLIQNLVVYKEGEKFHAVAGGRRLAACKYLVSKKEMDKNEPILCRIVKKEEATGMSLSENIHRERMHPADEFMAFNKLKEEGNSIKSIADEYGITQKEVKQRLVLADVDLTIVEAYRVGDVDLETVMAFTLEQKKEKQVEIFNANKTNINARLIKNLLTRESVQSDSSLAKFVGLSAYKKACLLYTSPSPRDRG